MAPPSSRTTRAGEPATAYARPRELFESPIRSAESAPVVAGGGAQGVLAVPCHSGLVRHRRPARELRRRRIGSAAGAVRGAATAGGVTAVSAPPGSGKTSLAGSWVGEARHGRRAAWTTVRARGARRAAVGVRHGRPRRDRGRRCAGGPDLRGNRAVEQGAGRATARDAAGGSRSRQCLRSTICTYSDSAEALASLERVLRQAPRAACGWSCSPRGTRECRSDRLRLRLAGGLTEFCGQRELRVSLAGRRTQLLTASGLRSAADTAARCRANTEDGPPALRLATISLRGIPIQSGSWPSSAVASARWRRSCARRSSTASRARCATSSCGPAVLEKVNGRSPMRSPAARIALGSCRSSTKRMRCCTRVRRLRSFVVQLPRMLTNFLRLEQRQADPAR